MSASFAAQPDALGRFGPYGGRYVPETLMDALRQLTEVYESARKSPEFQRDFDHYLRSYVGRPSLLYFAERLTKEAGGARIYLKREDLNHTGAHKINNCIGQALLTKRMGKPRVIAETGAGQHGVATATAAALFGLECQVYMGEEDVRRQKLNVFKMKALGTEVVSVRTGSRTLRDAINDAMRDWMATVTTTHYIIGSVVGPHPFPMMVREFQSVIGREARAQCLEQVGRLPDAVVACVGGGSNAAGMFAPFLDDASVEIIGVEAGGRGAAEGQHAATLSHGKPGVLHGAFSYVLQDADGQTANVHSVSAGLDYPGVGPEHSYWKDSRRVRYTSVDDAEALQAFHQCSRLEGILPALETAHAVVEAMREAAKRPKDDVVVVCFSGRGDKDCFEVAQLKVKPLTNNPIDDLFLRLRVQGRKAFIPFVTAGDPDVDGTVLVARTLATHGANLIEIGFPYSDPIADGPVIQASYTRALERGLKLNDVFACARRIADLPEIKGRQIPLAAMTSYSLIHRRGAETFLRQAAEAGLSGAIVPDLPLEESEALSALAAARDFKLIHLVTPTTPRDRAAVIARRSTGFLYCVSVAGITGERDRLPPELLDQLAWLRTQTKLPLCVGFGVSRPDHVRMLREAADGVIVGSALVRPLEQVGKRPVGEVATEIGELAKTLSDALNPV